METSTENLDFAYLKHVYDQTPGLPTDKLKAVLEMAWDQLSHFAVKDVIFAYDEAQNLADNATKEEYPVSMMLDTFQSIQRKNIPFMLLLTGLPTLFPKLVEARTYAERMFHVVFLDRLNRDSSRDAMLKPIEDADCPVNLGNAIVKKMIEISGRYPYLIQFLGREVYDVVLQKVKHPGRSRKSHVVVPFDEIVQKLDNDFFAGRWARATDRRRDLLAVIAELPNCEMEFTVQEVVERSLESLEKPFRPSHVSQMFNTLCESGLIFKNRHGQYSFAVPLLDRFIRRYRKIMATERTLPQFPEE
jgi:hypothetical protein